MASKKPIGRPKTVIDWNQVGKMLEAGASAEGIAATIVWTAKRDLISG